MPGRVPCAIRGMEVVVRGSSVGLVFFAALSAGCVDDVGSDADALSADVAVAPDMARVELDAAPSEPDAEPDMAGPDARFESTLPEWCQGQPEAFSFFVTSMDALWALSGSHPDDMGGGFGGNFGGLEGADAICQTIGEATGHGHKTWKAFLSATDDGDGDPVHAIERIGDGPWHDAYGRLIAEDLAGLMGSRPAGHEQAVNDLPDECGVPLTRLGDAHDVVTGSNREGRLFDPDPESTCHDWTSDDPNVGAGGATGIQAAMRSKLRCGHSFPRAGGRGGRNWVSDHGLVGCGKGAVLIQSFDGQCIGCLGGYGGLYCFAR